MAFSNYVFKVGLLSFPLDLIAPGGYDTTPNQRTDKNSYVDGKGDLHRTILPTKRSSVSIITLDDLTEAQTLQIQALFPNRDIVTASYWNKESNAYKTATFYMPSIKWVINRFDDAGQPLYKALELEFIAYGGDS
ncbi:MAG: hypothetical protein K0R34_2902 [Herbinix sp.]|jgi:hypothetical protein|nr:hypothetical protein [Herbinix sp.]